MFRLLSAPLYVQWEVTPRCNYECVHCYNHWREDRSNPNEQPNIELYDAVVSEIIANRMFSVTVTGGEPLLVIKAILPQLRRLQEAGIRVGLNSNLSLLTQDTVLMLKDVGVTSLLTSIPSANSDTNDHITQRRNSQALTTRGISLALKNGMSVVVNMVVTKLNKGDVFSTAQYVANLGVKYFSATKATVPGNCSDFSSYSLSLEEFRLMLSELLRAKAEIGLNVDSMEFYPTCAFADLKTRETFGLKRSCSAAKTNCTIGFDGQVRPCSHASQTYGDIRDGFQTVWLAMDEWRGDQWIPEQCQGCRLKQRCGGGCKVEALQVNGALNKPDPYCDFSQLPLELGTSRKLPDVFPSQSFGFNPVLKVREEPFGGILYVGPNSWVPVNSELFQFANGKKGGTATVKELAGAMAVSIVETTRLVNYLHSGSIIMEV